MRTDHERPLVSVVIVTWRSRHLIDRCLKPFLDHPSWVEVIVHDNASPDGTAEYIAANYPWVQLTSGTENLGFGKGNNAAFAHCRGKFILMLNPDAFLDDLNPVQTMAACLEADDAVGAVGPQLIHEDGRHQVGDAGWTTGLLSVAGHAFWLHRAFLGVPSIYLSNPKLLQRRSVDVDWICGACLMARRSLVQELGGFADDIFMYGEDVELGDRIGGAGYRLIYLPQIKVLHVQGATQKADGTVHYSARWMDARAKRFAMQRSRLAYFFFKLIMASGFGIRSVVLDIVGLASPRVRGQAEIMRRYAAHAAALMSYDAQRKTQV